MKISIIGTTNTQAFSNKNDMEIFSGHVAGVCYMKNDFASIINEPTDKTYRRIEQTKNSGHHSVYDHNYINLYLQDIPKAFAMLLNNEKAYTTSEKSARYTKMQPVGEQKELYEKWQNIFTEVIAKKYKQKYPEFFTDTKISKLAQENARYLISVFTPTSMVYSVSYRQLNYLYGFMQQELSNDNSNKFMQLLKPTLSDFCNAIEKLDIIDNTLQHNNKNRKFSLIETFNTNKKQYFGDVYQTTYDGTFAQLAQAQRHRTITYSFSLYDNPTFYTPPILKNDDKLNAMWQADCKLVSEQMPQGTMIKINECGTLENFILKMKERNCTHAQLEINMQTSATLQLYLNALQTNNHPMYQHLKLYSNGARCTFPNYTCKEKCSLPIGINQTREI